MSYSLFTGSPIILHEGHCQYFIIVSCLAENFGVSATFKSFFSFICFFVGICIFHVCWKCVSCLFPVSSSPWVFFFHSWLSVAAITMLRGKLAPHLLFMVLRKFLPTLCLCCKSIHLFFFNYDFYFYCHALKVPFSSSVNGLCRLPDRKAPGHCLSHTTHSQQSAEGLIPLLLQPSFPPSPKSCGIFFEQAKLLWVTSGSGPPERYDFQRSCVTPGLRR